MPQLQGLFQDPRFVNLSDDKQQEVLGRIDPRFAKLDSDQFATFKSKANVPPRAASPTVPMHMVSGLTGNPLKEGTLGEAPPNTFKQNHPLLYQVGANTVLLPDEMNVGQAGPTDAQAAGRTIKNFITDAQKREGGKLSKIAGRMRDAASKTESDIEFDAEQKQIAERFARSTAAAKPSPKGTLTAPKVAMRGMSEEEFAKAPREPGSPPLPKPETPTAKPSRAPVWQGKLTAPSATNTGPAASQAKPTGLMEKVQGIAKGIAQGEKITGEQFLKLPFREQSIMIRKYDPTNGAVTKEMIQHYAKLIDQAQ